VLYLDTAEDMQWLHDVHGIPPDMTCAILTGNEDAPRKIEAWRECNPHYLAAPDYIFTAE